MSSTVLTAIEDAREQLQTATEEREEAKENTRAPKRERIESGEPESVGESITVLIDEFGGLCADFRAYLGTFGRSTGGVRSVLGNLRDGLAAVDDAAGQMNDRLDGDGEPVFEPREFNPWGEDTGEQESASDDEDGGGFDPWEVGVSGTDRGR